MSVFHLRIAEPDDLNTLIAIDAAASTLYEQAGLTVDLNHDHPFVVAEIARWSEAIGKGLVTLAVDTNGNPLGFSVCGWVDQQPYLDQLSVAPARMRQGIGTALLNQAIEWSADRPLWLTTYASLSWNKPFYQRHSFVAVAAADCGPDIRDILDQQRLALPAPDDRIAMVRVAD